MASSLAGRMIISAALLALLMPQSAAYAQTPAASPLTVEALDNATYKPRHTEALGDTAQLVDGESVGTLYSGTGVRQSSYVFGDLNGDGTDDAVATVIEQLGGTAWDVIVAAYVNDSGAPSFAGSVAFGYSEIDSVTVDSGIITVSGRKVGNGDAICCPTQPFQSQFALQGDQLVDVSGSSTSVVKGFPGAVLLLPVDQPPYTSWPLQGIRLNPGPSYVEFAGDPIQRIGSDVLSIEASVGPSTYDPRNDFQPVCQPATPYCYYPPFGQSRGAEIFNGLKARGNDAFVWHKTFPNEMWVLSWFDKTSNTSYLLTFGGDDVVAMFAPLMTFNKNNVTAAQKLAAMADKLIPATPN